MIKKTIAVVVSATASLVFFILNIISPFIGDIIKFILKFIKASSSTSLLTNILLILGGITVLMKMFGIEKLPSPLNLFLAPFKLVSNIFLQPMQVYNNASGSNIDKAENTINKIKEKKMNKYLDVKTNPKAISGVVGGISFALGILHMFLMALNVQWYCNSSIAQSVQWFADNPVTLSGYAVTTISAIAAGLKSVGFETKEELNERKENKIADKIKKASGEVSYWMGKIPLLDKKIEGCDVENVPNSELSSKWIEAFKNGETLCTTLEDFLQELVAKKKEYIKEKSEALIKIKELSESTNYTYE